METPRTSVIVCVHNRPSQVVTCLESILASDVDDYEIVVVDDASTDQTPGAVEDVARQRSKRTIRLLRNATNLGVSGARNAGLREARGKYVLFTDSDCTVAPLWLRRIVEALECDDACAASGTVIDVEPPNLVGRAAAGGTRIGRTRWQGRSLVGGNMGFRREVALQYLFDESLVYGCDEDELAWRLESDGHSLCFVADAIVYHDHPMTLGSYLRQGFRQGMGSARFWYKRGVFIGRDLWALTGALAALPLGLLDGRLLLVSLILALLQLAALAANERFLKGKPWSEVAVVLPIAAVYTIVKAAAVYWTLSRITLRYDQSIRESKRRWVARQSALRTALTSEDGSTEAP